METVRLLEQLRNEVAEWRTDDSTLIRIPLEQKVISRSEAHQLINQIIEIVKAEISSTKKRPTVGLCFEDPKNWIISIIASQLAKVVTVPIPQEFTLDQIASFIPNLDFILTDSKKSTELLSQVFDGSIQVADFSLDDGSFLFLLKSNAENSFDRLNLPSDAIKVIHTSGSTNNPKGVVIGHQGLETVIQSMLERVSKLGAVHYVSILPFSLLLEQILGIYLPILSKGSIAILPRQVESYIGTQASLDPYLQTIKMSAANFSMVPPSFLNEFHKLTTHSQKSPHEYIGDTLQAVATGGAPVDVSCLEDFKENGVEIYQGYGLSENTSVVAWNYPGPNVLGSVGQALSHNTVRINSTGHVEVSGPSVFLGYVAEGRFSARQEGWLNTGDFGYFDNDGCLYITGRNSNLIVLSSGRNIAPEWIENKYKSLPGVKDFIVVGHGKSFPAAIILVDKRLNCESVLKHVVALSNEINDQFPEFARVFAFRAIPFDDQFYSVSGRVLRTKIMAKYSDLINEVYFDELRGEPRCKTMSL